MTTIDDLLKKHPNLEERIKEQEHIQENIQENIVIDKQRFRFSSPYVYSNTGSWSTKVGVFGR